MFSENVLNQYPYIINCRRIRCSLKSQNKYNINVTAVNTYFITFSIPAGLGIYCENK